MKNNIKSLLSAQKKSLDISLDSTQKTNLVAVFIDKNYKNNNLVHIPCHQGSAISGYPYDCTSDCYLCECVNYINVGFVEFVCYIRIHSTYYIKVPMSKNLCMKILNNDQKSLLKRFIKKNGYQNLDMEFLQTVTIR